LPKSVTSGGSQIPTTSMECRKPQNIKSGQASSGVLARLLSGPSGAIRSKDSSAMLVPARRPRCF
jgi:hypothetical protein